MHEMQKLLHFSTENKSWLIFMCHPSVAGGRRFSLTRLARRGIEKTVELIADAIVDVAMIVISAKGLEKPKEAAESLKILENHKFLTPSLAGKLQELVKFRNLLVHRYAKVDEGREYQNIDENHGDVIDFIKEMEVLLKGERGKTAVARTLKKED